MNTTYDEIYKSFIINCKVDPSDLPDTNEKRYDAINNAVMYFNNRLRRKIECNDQKEEVSEKLSQDDLLVLANYIKLIFLENEETEFTSIYGVFAKELGFRNYKDQVSAKKNIILRQKKKIDDLILNSITTWEV